MYKKIYRPEFAQTNWWNRMFRAINRSFPDDWAKKQIADMSRFGGRLVVMSSH